MTVRTFPPARRRPVSSREWIEYFRANAVSLVPIPWEIGPEITPQERDAIRCSIQEFQLGESSEGKHFKGVARAYAERTGDFAYVSALSAFIGEEHRHARDLGRFMESNGILLTGHSWPDSVFRWLRKRAGLELSITVLITAEIIARVYYAALRDATQSKVLRTLCRQILRDEVKHVQFQAERLAILRRGRRPSLLAFQRHAHRFLLLGTCFVVWHKHGRALSAGRYGFTRFWRETWACMREAEELMNPAGYVWDEISSMACDIVEVSGHPAEM